MDVSSVTAVAAAPAQSAATPATIDAAFGALLQSMVEAESAALTAPSIQSAALALVLPANAPTGQETSEQDNATAVPGSKTPGLFAPIAQPATPESLPGFPPSASAGQQNPQQNVAAIPQTTGAAILPSTTADHNEVPPPPLTATPAPTLVASVQSSAPQEATPAAPQPMTALPQSGLQSATQPPPATPVPEPVQAPVQATQQTVSPQTASPQADSSQNTLSPPSSTLDVAGQIVTPAPRDPAPLGVKPVAPKEKVAAEPMETPKRDDPTNAIVDVLAGFLLPQIEPITTPANDTTADTVDPVASTNSDDTPVIAATDQNTAAPVQPMPVAMVQTPAPVSAPVQTGEPIAPAAVGQATTPKNNTPADETATPAVAQKPAARQQSSHQTASERSTSQPIFVPANDTAPDTKPELQTAAEPRTAPTGADARTASGPDTSPPANAPNPPLHPASAAIANPAIQPLAPSGLRKLTAGLQVAVQEQETTSSIDKLGLTIATKSIDGLRHFDIRLDPPELGRVQVQLTTDDTGRSQANVVVDKPQTLELLQRDAQSLNRALNEAGLDVSNNGLNFSLREQSRQNDGGADQGRGRSLSVQAVMETDATHIHSSRGSYAPNSVRLDIRV